MTWNILSLYGPNPPIKATREQKIYQMDITAIKEIKQPPRISKSVIFFSENKRNAHEFDFF